ncbi:hypothetical protein ETAA8_63880 [Anatilimnocola aggregata]|uniref:Uncharacterized protein n=1 Tax=Anatilimnocola aggregata TaxID=2528021 RepID=A0A517YLY0_9BACT|nr:hypothetical protein [Anatilimnocola aggregata]QDU31235.1 hypothetical protein ETAA8_63880 [Anatilimnocola aggregata]
MGSKQNSLAIALGVLLVTVAVAATVIGWMTSDPNTKSGRLKRNLDAVTDETERRDREIEEMTPP